LSVTPAPFIPVSRSCDTRRLNGTWAVEAGYRHLSIEKDLDNARVDLDLSGPLVGITARF
jgi:hypothetical protein